MIYTPFQSYKKKTLERFVEPLSFVEPLRNLGKFTTLKFNKHLLHINIWRAAQSPCSKMCKNVISSLKMRAQGPPTKPGVEGIVSSHRKKIVTKNPRHRYKAHLFLRFPSAAAENRFHELFTSLTRKSPGCSTRKTFVCC